MCELACQLTEDLRVAFDEWCDRHQSFARSGRGVSMSFRGRQREAEPAEPPREIGEQGVGSALREAPTDVDGLLRRGQRLLAAAEVGEPAAEVTQAPRETGEEVVLRSALREAPTDVDGL